MSINAFREELSKFYLQTVDKQADEFGTLMFSILDSMAQPGMNGFERKSLQYRAITENCTPRLFHTSPFYHELGTLTARCDGCGDFHGHRHAGNWNYNRSFHMFVDQNPELYNLRMKQGEENLLYLICGPFCDTLQHFIFDCRPIFKGGLKSLYERAQEQMRLARTKEEISFLDAGCEGLLCLKRLSERFADLAKERLKCATNDEEIKYLKRIADSAKYTPWNPPRSFYEALNTLAFIRTSVGALEGVGFNTFGRPDVDLYGFYKDDLAAGRLTKEEAYELVEKFLLTWDLHYDHDSKMEGYSDHELENTYTLGGCDRNGVPVWNELTEMFLKITREHKIIFPKITVRYGIQSPKAYLDEADKAVIKGTSSILYENDDCIIPALVKDGIQLEDAREYLVTGCWEVLPYGSIMYDNGNYVNLLKAFEFSIHNRRDKMDECKLWFESIDSANSFEEVYRITIENFRKLLKERNRMTLEGKPTWPKADPLPLNSMAMAGCIEARKDLTDGGCKYHDEVYMMVGFPNVIDSLLAIKELCFDKHEYTLCELLNAVRNNWAGYELMRRDVLNCHFWGDESMEMKEMATRLNGDLHTILRELKTLWPGGVIRMGHITYTEIRFWGEKTLATPDGRHNGEYFSQGLTPSRLHRIPSVTSVINSLKCLNPHELSGNTVINIILPSPRMTLDNCETFLRACTKSAMGSLQLNCTTKEELLDAQIHPEAHKDLIVRVTGFSAKFTSLSPEWQQEFLSRNFYD